MASLFELASAAADVVDLPAFAPPSSPFDLEDVDLVRTAFPNATAAMVEDALVFRTAQPVLDHPASLDRIADLSPEKRASFLGEVALRVDAVISRKGAFRVPKSSGCFVADV